MGDVVALDRDERLRGCWSSLLSSMAGWTRPQRMLCLVNSRDLTYLWATSVVDDLRKPANVQG